MKVDSNAMNDEAHSYGCECSELLCDEASLLTNKEWDEVWETLHAKYGEDRPFIMNPDHATKRTILEKHEKYWVAR